MIMWFVVLICGCIDVSFFAHVKRLGKTTAKPVALVTLLFYEGPSSTRLPSVAKFEAVPSCYLEPRNTSGELLGCAVCHSFSFDESLLPSGVVLADEMVELVLGVNDVFTPWVQARDHFAQPREQRAEAVTPPFHEATRNFCSHP